MKMCIRKHISILTLSLGIWIALPFYSIETHAEGFYEGHAEGWHWYKNTIEEEKEEENKKPQQVNAVSEMNTLKAAVTKALDTAILYPTDANVANYIMLQNRVSNQASLFADVWQKVLLHNANLNYELIHPTNTLARRIDIDQQREKENAAIARLARESGLFFFYSSSCSYCRKFAPILKSFATTYRISVIPISMDGKFLPEFPDSKVDKGQSRKFNVTVEPSLFAVNPHTGKAYPVAHGLVSQSELRSQILKISQNFVSGT